MCTGPILLTRTAGCALIGNTAPHWQCVAPRQRVAVDNGSVHTGYNYNNTVHTSYNNSSSRLYILVQCMAGLAVILQWSSVWTITSPAFQHPHTLCVEYQPHTMCNQDVSNFEIQLLLYVQCTSPFHDRLVDSQRPCRWALNILQLQPLIEYTCTYVPEIFFPFTTLNSLFMYNVVGNDKLTCPRSISYADTPRLHQSTAQEQLVPVGWTTSGATERRWKRERESTSVYY